MSFEMKLTLRGFNRLVKNGDVRICQKLVSPLLQLTKWLDDATMCIYCTRVFIVDGCGFVDVAVLGGQRLSVDYKQWTENSRRYQCQTAISLPHNESHDVCNVSSRHHLSYPSCAIRYILVFSSNKTSRFSLLE